ncbi:MAG TPA: hypothetical protein DD415_00175 [Clostridiales bacterium]|nr:hypothetical protein [Clostridiales bacterium]
MTEILAVFRSRSQAMDCNARLRAMGIAANLINTPREANVGCGLSLKIPPSSFERAKILIRKCNYSAFYGFLRMQNDYGRVIFGRI